MTLTFDERRTLAAADQIKRKRNRETRMKIAAARKPGGKASRGREIDTGFLQFLRRQPCQAAGFLGPCVGPIQAAHISYRVAGIPNSFGRGVKNHDRHATSLCAEHHARQHAMGDERKFWAGLGKDAYETAASLFAEYQGASQ